LYGLLPVGLLMYIMGTPGRKRAIKAREAEQQFVAGPPQDEFAPAGGSDPQSGGAWGHTSAQPDAGSLPPSDPVAPEGKEP
jgi:hypothetical protein